MFANVGDALKRNLGLCFLVFDSGPRSWNGVFRNPAPRLKEIKVTWSIKFLQVSSSQNSNNDSLRVITDLLFIITARLIVLVHVHSIFA